MLANRDLVCQVYNEVLKTLYKKAVYIVEQRIESCKFKIKNEFEITAEEFMLISDSNLNFFKDNVCFFLSL